MSKPKDAPRHCPSCLADNAATLKQCGRCGESLAGAYAPGSVLADRYQIIEALGSGGMGVVFKARDVVLEETMALKLLRPDLTGPSLARFRSEIKLARQVAHRNVCRIFEYGEAGSARFIVMELLAGDTLRQLVKRGPLDVETALQLAEQAADGLGAIHEAGIVHRDVKPANLLLTGNGVLKVMDFGIAKSIGAEGVTETGMLVGTPEYMSPEQASGRAVDGRSDLYSLGIVLYELISADLPFRGDTPIATLWKHMNETASFDTPTARQIPDEVRPLLSGLLAKTPEGRPATASDVASALRTVSTARAGPATATTRIAPPPAAAPRRRRRLWPLALLMVGAGAGLAALLNQTPAPTPSPSDASPAAPVRPSPSTRPSSPRPSATPTSTPTNTPTPGDVASSQLLSRVMAALDRGDAAAARRNLDAVLSRKDPIRLPMAREKKMVVDRLTLVYQPSRTTTTPSGGMEVSAPMVMLEDQQGASVAKEMASRVKVEEMGQTKPAANAADRSPGAFIRMKLGGDAYTLYFWPSKARCRTAQRLGSSNSFLQCDAAGLEQQSFVAEYLGGLLSRSR